MSKIKSISVMLAVLLSFSMITTVSCDKNRGSSKKTPIENESSPADNDITPLTVSNNSSIELKHEDALVINLDSYELNEFDLPFDGTIASIKCAEDKIITCIYPDDENGCLETGVFDPYSGTYEKIERLPFSAAYGSYMKVISDRYFVMIYSCESSDRLSGRVMVYDMETGKSDIIDEYDIHNIVQYVTKAGENGIAYYYYEAETQDWILKYYDMNTGEAKEIFRQKNSGEKQVSPMALTDDGDNIVLVTQYIEDEVYHTCLTWISYDGNIFKTEETGLQNFFGDTAYEITDFVINDSNYFIKVRIDEKEEYFFLSRDKNELSVKIPAICRLNKMLDEFPADSSSILFQQNEYILGDLINVDLKNNTFRSYMLNYRTMSDGSNIIAPDYVKINNSGDMLLFYVSDQKIEYQIIKDYASINKKQRDYTLYEPPVDKNIMIDNDFRWKFLYG